MNIYRIWFTDELEQDVTLVAEFRSHVLLTACKTALSKEAKLRGLQMLIRVNAVKSIKSEMC